MTTTFRTEPEIRTESAWRSPRFQRFAAITVGTALLLSFVAISCLNADVNNLKAEKIPTIEGKLAELQNKILH